MKSFLLLMHDDAGQEARFQTALDLARAFEGHLTCLDVACPPVLEYELLAQPMIVGGDLEQAQAEQSKMREKFVGRLSVEDVSWDWQDATGDFPSQIVRAAEFADLVILSSQIGRKDAGSAHVTSDVVMNTDRPVLAVPPECAELKLDGEVLIAWDGSRTANASLRASLPLLRLAQGVTLFEATGGGTDDLSIEDAATYLSRHGIHAEIERRPRGTSISTTIRKEIGDLNPSYLVMGAFGHSRLIEDLFGGVTRSMLSNCDVPLLLAHREN